MDYFVKKNHRYHLFRLVFNFSKTFHSRFWLAKCFGLIFYCCIASSDYLAKATEKEFKQYFYDEYGEGAFAEGEIDQLVKMYNDYKTEEAEKEKEAEGDAEEEGEEDDPLAGI